MGGIQVDELQTLTVTLGGNKLHRSFQPSDNFLYVSMAAAWRLLRARNLSFFNKYEPSTKASVQYKRLNGNFRHLEDGFESRSRHSIDYHNWSLDDCKKFYGNVST